MNPANMVGEELWSFVRRSYESEAWANAILDAVHHFGDVLRTKSGLQSDGTALVGQAFGGKEPKIQVNRLTTESEKNVQAGVEAMARGLYLAIRNPRSHERLTDTKQDCDAILIFVDYLLRAIGHSKDAFSIEALVEHISDENFVQNKRYSELMLNDIPKGKRLDALIATFERLDNRVMGQRKDFFRACLASLEPGERDQFFEVINAKLKTGTDDLELRTIFQLLEPHQWLLISESVRLRSEYRVIKNLQSGLYTIASGRCERGGMATWANSFFPHFSLKTELLRAIIDLLRMPAIKQQDYALKFFFFDLPRVSDKPSATLVTHIKGMLNKGDERYREAIDTFEEFGYSEWSKPFEESLLAFKPRTLPPMDDFADDDIPF